MHFLILLSVHVSRRAWIKVNAKEQHTPKRNIKEKKINIHIVIKSSRSQTRQPRMTNIHMHAHNTVTDCMISIHDSIYIIRCSATCCLILEAAATAAVLRFDAGALRTERRKISSLLDSIFLFRFRVSQTLKLTIIECFSVPSSTLPFVFSGSCATVIMSFSSMLVLSIFLRSHFCTHRTADYDISHFECMKNKIFRNR